MRGVILLLTAGTLFAQVQPAHVVDVGEEVKGLFSAGAQIVAIRLDKSVTLLDGDKRALLKGSEVSRSPKADVQEYNFRNPTALNAALRQWACKFEPSDREVAKQVVVAAAIDSGSIWLLWGAVLPGNVVLVEQYSRGCGRMDILTLALPGEPKRFAYPMHLAVGRERIWLAGEGSVVAEYRRVTK